MNNRKMEALESETFTRYSILMRAKRAFEVIDTIQNYGADYDYHFFIRNNSFIGYSHHTYWRMLILELAKLYGSNAKTHKFILSKYISKFKKGGSYATAGISTDVISNWENDISQVQQSISSVMEIRDTLVAHTDNKEAPVNQNIDPNLIGIASGILEHVDQKLYAGKHGANLNYWESPAIGLLHVLNLLRADFDGGLKEDGKIDYKLIE